MKLNYSIKHIFTLFILLMAGQLLAQNCANGAMTLTLNFDSNPGDIIWRIKNSSYQNVVEGSNYGSQAPNSSLSIPISAIANGDYVLTVIDMNGDGNTSYTLDDGSNIMINETGSFAYSKVTQFCSGATTGAVLDTQAPTAPSNLVVDTVYPTAVDISWTAATDNHSVWFTAVFINGMPADTFANTTTYTINFLQPNTTYTFKLIARDFAGNYSPFSNSVTVTTPPNVTSTTVHQGFFESGWDGWTDGGSNCARVNSANNSFEGNRSVRLRNGTSSSNMTLSNVFLGGYDVVDFSFHVLPKGIDNGESFTVDYFDGAVWQAVATFHKGADFQNNSFYRVDVTLNGNDVNLTNNSGFRIQNNANNNRDKIYIDQTEIIGYTGSSVASSSSIQQVNRAYNGGDFDLEASEENNLTLSMYPNPAQDRFALSTSEEIVQVTIYNMYRQVMKQYRRASQYDVSELSEGIYIINVEFVNGEQQQLTLVKK